MKTWTKIPWAFLTPSLPLPHQKSHHSSHEQSSKNKSSNNSHDRDGRLRMLKKGKGREGIEATLRHLSFDTDLVGSKDCHSLWIVSVELTPSPISELWVRQPLRIHMTSVPLLFPRRHYYRCLLLEGRFHPLKACSLQTLCPGSAFPHSSPRSGWFQENRSLGPRISGWFSCQALSYRSHEF